MPWLWTDDLARLLIEASLASESDVQGWLTRPMAVAAAEDSDPIEVARRLAGIPGDQPEVAGAA